MSAVLTDDELTVLESLEGFAGSRKIPVSQLPEETNLSLSRAMAASSSLLKKKLVKVEGRDLAVTSMGQLALDRQDTSRSAVGQLS